MIGGMNISGIHAADRGKKSLLDKAGFSRKEILQGLLFALAVVMFSAQLDNS
jgi:hypothetical protein